MAPTTTVTGVQSDANRQLGDSVPPAHLLGVVVGGDLHVERGVASPDRVVLVGHRRPEQRHDPVAHDLVHRALVAVDGLHRRLEHRTEELLGLFGVAVGQELHRPLQVGEEDRHLLALALERGLRGQNLLREMLGSVRPR